MYHLAKGLYMLATSKEGKALPKKAVAVVVFRNLFLDVGL